MEILDAILKGNQTSVKVPPEITPSEVCDYMESLGYEHEIDCNGWQHDFWIYFRKEKASTYVLGGCWFYGGQTFSLDEESIEDDDDDDEYIAKFKEGQSKLESDLDASLAELSASLGIPLEDSRISVEEFHRKLNEMDKD